MVQKNRNQRIPLQLIGNPVNGLERQIAGCLPRFPCTLQLLVNGTDSGIYGINLAVQVLDCFESLLPRGQCALYFAQLLPQFGAFLLQPADDLLQGG